VRAPAIAGVCMAVGTIVAGCGSDGPAPSTSTSRPGTDTTSTTAPDNRIEHGHGEGPLDAPGPAGFRAEGRNTGDVFTNGSVLVFNRGDVPITIESVRPEVTGDLTVLGVQIAGPERDIGFTDVYLAFPPPTDGLGPVADADGFVLPAGEPGASEGFELLIGFRVGDADRSVVTAIVIDYTADGERYQGRFINTMVVCPGVVDNQDELCPFEYGGA